MQMYMIIEVFSNSIRSGWAGLHHKRSWDRFHHPRVLL